MQAAAAGGGAAAAAGGGAAAAATGGGAAGMEVAPRPVSKDDLPFRPPSRHGRTWVQPAAPCYDPRAELQIEVSCSYPEGGTVSVLLLAVDYRWAGPVAKKEPPGCGARGTP